MIIVSQDKRSIVIIDNVTSIWIEDPEENDSEKFSIEVSAEINECLGYYETEDKAKEILQEIVRKYKLGTNKIKIKTSRGADIVERNIIYEMPKE